LLAARRCVRHSGDTVHRSNGNLGAVIKPNRRARDPNDLRDLAR
jgi:hypothetical protein